MKKKKWNITNLIATGSIAIIRLLISVLFYISVLVATGNALAAISFIFIGPFFAVLTALVINRFGSVLLYSIIFFIANLPLPNIWPKLFQLITVPLNGFIVDTIWLRLRKKQKIFSFVAGFIFNSIVLIESFILLANTQIQFTVPQIIFQPLYTIGLVLLCGILGGVSGLIALTVYNKIKNTSVVRRIQK